MVKIASDRAVKTPEYDSRVKVFGLVTDVEDQLVAILFKPLTAVAQPEVSEDIAPVTSDMRVSIEATIIS
jgi:hypothetical protein